MVIPDQQIELESCSSPLQTGKSCSLDRKKGLSLGRQVFCLHNGRMFMHICLHLDDVTIAWQPTNRADFVAQTFFGF